MSAIPRVVQRDLFLARMQAPERRKNFAMTSFERKRLAAGKSIRDMAELMGVTYQTICQWEHGLTTPRAAQFPKLAEIFGISSEEVTYLFAPEDTPPRGPQPPSEAA